MLLRMSLSWVVLAVIGVANGILRGTTYGRFFSDRTAHQISTVTCVLGVFLGAYFMLRNTVVGARDRVLLAVGAGWTAATVAFEFGFGHYVARESWQDLLHAYDLRAGQVWSAVPLAILVTPLLVKRIVVRQLTERG